ncbi:hypothetical protein B9T36_14220 [Acinetobacter sp. ANC 4204]|nr:hypothetical protein B9T36_14220 [Acinetobacter sp. ANC 4204]
MADTQADDFVESSSCSFKSCFISVASFTVALRNSVFCFGIVSLSSNDSFKKECIKKAFQMKGFLEFYI